MGKALSQSLVRQGYEVLGCGAREEQRESICMVAHAFTTDIHETLENSDAAILAVKPQVFRTLSIEGKDTWDTLIVSVMAGITIESIRAACRQKRIIRAMPNLAITQGAGVTSWIANEDCGESEKTWMTEILEELGMQIELPSEEIFHGMTAITGSGPGIIASLLEGAYGKVLEGDIENEELLWQVLKGMVVLHEEEGLTFREMAEKVASKGGTTEAGIDYLHAHGSREQIGEAFAAAKQRSMELARGE